MSSHNDFPSKSGRCYQIRDDALEAVGSAVGALAAYLTDELEGFCSGVCLNCVVEEARHGVRVVLNSSGALVLGATQSLERLAGLKTEASSDQDS